MSILLFSISSTSVLSKPGTNSDSNDGHGTPSTTLYPPPFTASRLVSGHCPPYTPSSSTLGSPGRAERGSQPVRHPCSPHQLGESRRQPCILTSLVLTSWGGMRLSLEDFRNRRDKPHEGVDWNDATPDHRSAEVITVVYIWAQTLGSDIHHKERQRQV